LGSSPGVIRLLLEEEIFLNGNKSLILAVNNPEQPPQPADRKDLPDHLGSAITRPDSLEEAGACSLSRGFFRIVPVSSPVVHTGGPQNVVWV
jgi:hypothetical protein